MNPLDRHRVHTAMTALGVVPSGWINETVSRFVRENFHEPSSGGEEPGPRASLVVGVHYRGTDHADELPGNALVPIELFIETVRKVLQRKRGGEAVVFVASDSKEAVTTLRGALESEARVVSAADVVRREKLDDVVAIHRQTGEGRRKGGEVLVDSLLLAACDELVHAQSNVALFAAYTNPRLRLHYLGHREVFGFHDRQAETPPRYRLDFRAFGDEPEAASQVRCGLPPCSFVGLTAVGGCRCSRSEETR